MEIDRSRSAQGMLIGPWLVLGLILIAACGGAGIYYWNEYLRTQGVADQKARADKELTEWHVATQLGTMSALESFLKAYPSGRFAEEAAKQIRSIRTAEDRDWSEAAKEHSARSYRGYLAKWSQGRFVEEAERRMKQLSSVEDAISRERNDWEIVNKGGTRQDYEKFLQNWPTSRFAQEARRKLTLLDQAADNAAWQEALKAGTRESYELYINKYPKGLHSAEANRFLKEVPLSSEAEMRLQSGDQFKECPICPDMVVIPSGAFKMGSPQSQIEQHEVYENEGPEHQVKIAQTFAVGKVEVTFAQWDACTAEGGCGGYRPVDNGWGRDSRPVMNVSWDDAKLFIRWLSKKTGKQYRLLSEAEWEYAARAGSSGKFFFGEDSRSLCRYANVADETGSANRRGNEGFGSWMLCSDGYWHTAPVGSFAPNSFKLHDMLGNVSEWVEDVWHENYRGAPSDGTAWTDGDPQFRVARGGSFYHLEGGVRSAVRFKYKADSHGELIGLRVARSLSR
jgi:formylglycine-generating enzyme required for sulfatase activity